MWRGICANGSSAPFHTLPWPLPPPRWCGRILAEKGGDNVDIVLTQDAEYLLCVLYDAYKRHRKDGAFEEEARAFGGSEDIQSEYIQNWPTNDIDSAALALDRKGMLAVLFADDALAESCLTDDGIAYMEQRFGNKLDKLTQRLATLRTVLFG